MHAYIKKIESLVIKGIIHYFQFIKLNYIMFKKIKALKDRTLYDQDSYKQLRESQEPQQQQKASIFAEQIAQINQMIKITQYQQQKIKKKQVRNNKSFAPQNKYIIYWGLLHFICVYVYFFQLPITMGFSNGYLIQQEVNFPLVIINCFCILIFVTNIGIRLKTSFYKDGILIDQQKQIVKNYFSFQFYIDLISIGSLFPSQIYRLKHQLNKNQNPINDSKIFLISLFFYSRILIVANDVQSINKSLQLHRRSKALFSLLMLLVHVLLISSIYASIFFYISTTYCPIGTSNMINQEYICWIETVYSKGLVLNDLYQPWYVQYGFSLYWAATTMISIGYGDITPKNTGQVYFTIFAQFTSCVLYAYVINKIWQVKSQYEAKQEKYQLKVTIINRFMRDKNVSFLLKSKINAYLAHFYTQEKIRQKQFQNEVINELAPMLKQELIMQVYGSVFKQNKIFQNFSQDFLIQISSKINQVRYSENQIIYEIENYQQIDYCLHYIFTGEIQIYLELQKKKKSIKKLPKYNLFEVYQFFTGMRTIYKASATCYSSIYSLNYSIWKQKIVNYIEDCQKFQQMKDLAKYERNLKPLCLKCDLCESSFHITEKCSSESLKRDHLIFIQNYRKIENERIDFDRTDPQKIITKKKIKVQSSQIKLFHQKIQNRQNYSLISNSSEIVNHEIYQSQISQHLPKVKPYSPLRLDERRLSLQIQDQQNPKNKQHKQNEFKQVLDINQEEEQIKNEQQNQLIRSINMDSKQSYQNYFKHYNIENIILKSMKLRRLQSDLRNK